MFTSAGFFFLVLLAAAIAAFWPGYLSKPPKTVDVYTHVHAVTMLAWSLLLVAQPFLIRARRRPLHRALGALSYALAPMVVVSSLLVAHLRFKTMSPVVFLAEARNLFLPVSAVFLFGVCWGLGIAYRKVTLLHSAFMICTGLTMIDPIFGRILFHYVPPLPNFFLYQAITFGATDLILLWLAYGPDRELQTRWAFGTMLKVFVPVHILWFTLAPSAAWLPIARWFRSRPLT